MMNTATRQGGYLKKHALPSTCPEHLRVSTCAHPHEDQQAIKKQEGKRTKAEAIPKVGTGKGDAHIFKTILSKRSTTSPISCTPTHLGHSHFHTLSICSHPCFPPACHQVLTKAQPTAEAAASLGSESNPSPRAGGSPCWGEGKRDKKEGKRREDDLLS